MQISFSQPPAGCKFHSVDRHPDANFIQSAPAGCKLHWLAAMQYKIPSLHAASDQPNEIFILLAASRMQILQKQAASTLLSC
jgi:hypothetical protein